MFLLFLPAENRVSFRLRMPHLNEIAWYQLGQPSAELEQGSALSTSWITLPSMAPKDVQEAPAGQVLTL